MIIPDPQTNPEIEPKPRKPKTSSTGDPAVPKRKRKTKAEKEAERLAEANKPIEPQFWFIVGAALTFVAALIYFDPVTFAEAGQSASDGMWIRDLLVIIVGILGRVPTALALGALAVVCLWLGVRGWLHKRSASNSESNTHP